MTQTIEQILARWDSGDGKPYKGSLIDWAAYEADPENMGCMCAQGQVLALAGGWDYAKLRDTAQSDADIETAKLLNISRAHAVLLRNINDKADGAPSIVLTDPGKVLGDQWSKLLDFWWMFDGYSAADWHKVAAARVAAGDDAKVAAWVAAWNAARDAAWDAARDAAAVAAEVAAWVAAKVAAGVAAWNAARDAAGEIQGFDLLIERGHKPFSLPMFGIATPADIPARPADYGNGIVPTGDA
jgi:hypothetical protein